MIKWIIRSVLILAGLALAFVLYVYTAFPLFDVEVTEVSKLDVPNNEYTVKIWYSSGSGLDNCGICVVKEKSRVNIRVAAFELYDSVVANELIDDTLLRLVLTDSDSKGHVADTFIVNLSDSICVIPQL